MSRPRQGKALPKRVYIKSGAYRFLPAEPMVDPKDGKTKTWITLCSVEEGEAAMQAALADLLGDQRHMEAPEDSMPWLCGQYKARKLGKYSLEVQKQYKAYLDLIAADFIEYMVPEVTTMDCAKFLRNHFKQKHNTAKKYARLMRRLFKLAIGEGLRQDNPADQLDLDDYETQRREILPTHEEISAIRAAGLVGADKRKTYSGPMFACIIDMEYLCWQRALDIRTLRETQITDEYIQFTPSKTKKTSKAVVEIYITPAIRAVIERARAIKIARGVISPFLFPTRKGTAYAKTGLISMFNRARQRAGVRKDVTFKDLRALGATDARKRGETLRKIQDRLAHTSTKTTEIYIKEVVPKRSDLVIELPWCNDGEPK